MPSKFKTRPKLHENDPKVQEFLEGAGGGDREPAKEPKAPRSEAAKEAAAEKPGPKKPKKRSTPTSAKEPVQRIQKNLKLRKDLCDDLELVAAHFSGETQRSILERALQQELQRMRREYRKKTGQQIRENVIV